MTTKNQKTKKEEEVRGWDCEDWILFIILSIPVILISFAIGSQRTESYLKCNERVKEEKEWTVKAYERLEEEHAQLKYEHLKLKKTIEI